MRDKKRIKKILGKIEVFWERYPDLRLGQMITNAIGPKFDDTTLFYLEDEDLEKALDKNFEEYKRAMILNKVEGR